MLKFTVQRTKYDANRIPEGHMFEQMQREDVKHVHVW